MTPRQPGNPAREASGSVWSIDPVIHSGEVDRFWTKVVRGPAATDCWLWAGAIADDGYGRFQIRRGRATRVVRPHRYALALAYGIDLDEVEVAEHAVCDVPVCVRVQAQPDDHVWPSTQAQNLARMAWRARGGGAAWSRHFRGVSRADRTATSRALRAAVAGGWDGDRIALLLDRDRDQLPLW